MVIKKLPAFYDGNGCSVVILVHKWYMHPETKSQNAFPAVISTLAIMPVYFIVTLFFDIVQQILIFDTSKAMF